MSCSPATVISCCAVTHRMPIGGFYNLDIHREPNAIVLRNMRKRREALANRYRVEFIETTGDIVMPDIPEPEHRKQEETTTDGTSLSAIRHRARRRGLVFSKSRKDGGLYRLAMADGSILLARTSTPRWTRSRRS
jgi:hypothetical protein